MNWFQMTNDFWWGYGFGVLVMAFWQLVINVIKVLSQ